MSGDDITEELSNLTLNCAASNIQSPIMLPYSSALTITVRVLQAMYYTVIMFAGIFLNSMVIALVAKYKKLQNLFFFVSLQVVVLDVFLSIMLVATPISAIANQWLFGEHVCAVTGFLLSTAALARTLLMFVFVVDRYLAIFWPFFYPKHKLKVTVLLSVCSWAISILVSIAMLPALLDCYRFSLTTKMCGVSSVCSMNCFIFINTYTIILIAPATILPVAMYAALYYKARKIRSQIETAGAKNVKNEWKATITFSLLFITLLVIILPVIIISITIANVSPESERPPAAFTVQAFNSGWILLLVITDPVVIMRNAGMREVISKIKAAMVQKWRPSHKQPRHTDEDDQMTATSQV